MLLGIPATTINFGVLIVVPLVGPMIDAWLCKPLLVFIRFVFFRSV